MPTPHKNMFTDAYAFEYLRVGTLNRTMDDETVPGYQRNQGRRGHLRQVLTIIRDLFPVGPKGTNAGFIRAHTDMLSSDTDQERLRAVLKGRDVDFFLEGVSGGSAVQHQALKTLKVLYQAD